MNVLPPSVDSVAIAFIFDMSSFISGQVTNRRFSPVAAIRVCVLKPALTVPRSWLARTGFENVLPPSSL